MENERDQAALLEQLKLLKNHHKKTRDYLTAIELLLVDDNNGRVKDASFSSDLQNLSKKVSDIDSDIDFLSNKL